MAPMSNFDFGVLLLLGFLVWRMTKPKAAAQLDAPNVGATSEDEDPLDSEDWDYEYGGDPVNIRVTLKLNYRDSAGNITERIVDVKECETTGNQGHLIGFCRMRGAIRTFRIDRIISVIDLDTGEVIPALQQWVTDKYKHSATYSIDQLFADSYDTIRLLLYVANLDGRFSKQERELLRQFCINKAGNADISQSDLDRAFKYVDRPSKQAFKLLCGKLAKLEKTDREEIVSICKQIIASEKTISSVEMDAMAYLTKRLTTESILNERNSSPTLA
jgi:uncharacterized tellurite resistance protein B-like protein